MFEPGMMVPKPPPGILTMFDPGITVPNPPPGILTIFVPGILLPNEAMNDVVQRLNIKYINMFNFQFFVNIIINTTYKLANDSHNLSISS